MKAIGGLADRQVMRLTGDHARWLSAGFIGAMLATCFLLVAVHGLNRPVGFDGAMNLQVAQSLAEGEGYVRNYNGPRPFPREVQTNTPYVVPAALVFKLFGVGLVQSQIINLLYMAGFLGLVVLVLSRFYGMGIGLAAALSCVLIPGFSHIGMNGWGEIVSLFWWLLGTYLLLGDTDNAGIGWRKFLAAICLGLALATKTIFLIGICATTTVYGLWLLVERRGTLFRAGTTFLAVGAALAAPLLAVEVWRGLALGGLDSYVLWWQDQLAAITMQTGAVALVSEDTSVLGKVGSRFHALTNQLELPGYVVAPWLAIPVLLSLLVLRKPSLLRQPVYRIWLAVLLLAGVYLTWWLAITPSTHVRLRRIMVGLVAVQLLWLFCAGWAANISHNRFTSVVGRTTSIVAVFLPVLVFNAVFLWVFQNTMRKNLAINMVGFTSAMDFIRRLPADAKLFGKGFLSAPVMSLYSGREVDDIDRYTALDLAELGDGYLLIDPPAAQAKRFASELQRYENRVVLDRANQRVHYIDFTRTRNPFPAPSRESDLTLPYVDFRERAYPFVYGLQKPSGDGWRWATTDMEILLRYGGERFVQFVVFTPNKPYSKPSPLTLAISVDDCRIGSHTLDGHGEATFTLAIPPDCMPDDGRNVRLGIVADNMFPPVPNDLRELSFILAAAGFSRD